MYSLSPDRTLSLSASVSLIFVRSTSTFSSYCTFILFNRFWLCSNSSIRRCLIEISHVSSAKSSCMLSESKNRTAFRIQCIYKGFIVTKTCHAHIDQISLPGLQIHSSISNVSLFLLYTYCKQKWHILLLGALLSLLCF